MSHYQFTTFQDIKCNTLSSEKRSLQAQLSFYEDLSLLRLSQTQHTLRGELITHPKSILTVSWNTIFDFRLFSIITIEPRFSIVSGIKDQVLTRNCTLPFKWCCKSCWAAMLVIYSITILIHNFFTQSLYCIILVDRKNKTKLCNSPELATTCHTKRSF